MALAKRNNTVNLPVGYLYPRRILLLPRIYSISFLYVCMYIYLRVRTYSYGFVNSMLQVSSLACRIAWWSNVLPNQFIISPFLSLNAGGHKDHGVVEPVVREPTRDRSVPLGLPHTSCTSGGDGLSTPGQPRLRTLSLAISN